MGAPSKADAAVEHVLAAILRDGRKAYLIGFGTESFALLTAAYAERHGLDVEAYRADFWSKCVPVRVEVTESET